LYDASRGTTLTIDYTTNLIRVAYGDDIHLYDYDITSFTYSLARVIPDGWTF
jgi:hypothetical protein